MDFDVSWFADPARRRMWLLNKALEKAPLGEALTLARRAEAFLAGRVERRQEDIAAHPSTVSTRVH